MIPTASDNLKIIIFMWSFKNNFKSISSPKQLVQVSSFNSTPVKTNINRKRIYGQLWTNESIRFWRINS